MPLRSLTNIFLYILWPPFLANLPGCEEGVQRNRQSLGFGPHLPAEMICDARPSLQGWVLLLPC